jgi:hypothetical protein
MVTHMRRFLAMISLLVGGMAMLGTTPALADNPSPARIRAAVKKAEESSSLWATVNICNSRHYRNDLGIRGQMPSLGFAAWLSMDVKLYYYSPPQKRYLRVPKRGSKLVRLGRSSSGFQQSGAMFEFSSHQPTLKAIVTFMWRRSGQLLGQAQRTTTAGHRNADFASPAHYSAATCTIR